ncbi:DUF4190 domain-containing protein [Streptococcus sp. 27098_8_69]|uniref:DUF4190 domain-containing protein n=1 Tax=Streptococcus sp. 27098_8_69 TaxID=3003664 RepID=UPI00352E7E1B
MQEKKKNPLIVGILSIVLGLLNPFVGLFLGIVGLVLAISLQKEPELDYKKERTLNIVGIVVFVINLIVAIARVYG